MKRILFLILLLISITEMNAQIRNLGRGNNNNMFRSDSTTFMNEVQVKLDGKTKYTDYRMFTIDNDTAIVDTTLTLYKNFKFNYIRKDKFELLPFHNLGQTFNRLGYHFTDKGIIPGLGATAKHFNYYDMDDVPFYKVPTPTTELMYITAMEQGQLLDALLTVNTSPELNLSMAYKGLRSLGHYRHSLASHGNFRTTFNYRSKNGFYQLRGHFYSYDFLNNENGGLTDLSITNFETNDPNYTDRARLETVFTDAENMYEGKRYYLDQQVTLISRKNRLKNSLLKALKDIAKDSLASKEITRLNDSIVNLEKNDLAKLDSLNLKNQLVLADSIQPSDSADVKTSVADSIKAVYDVELKKIANIKLDSTSKSQLDNTKEAQLYLGSTLYYETKHYRFKQGQASEILGETWGTESISDHTAHQTLNTGVFLGYESATTGKLRAKINYFDYNYFYNSILYLNDQTIPDKLEGSGIITGADWKTSYGKFHLKADASSIISDQINGNSIKAEVSFKKDSVYNFRGFAEVTSKSPDFNKILYQSDYKKYNWSNDFKNEEIKSIGFKLEHEKYGFLKASYNLVDNYTYFDEFSIPTQTDEQLKYLRATANFHITYRNFTWDNTLLYQKVDSGADFFKVPEYLGRSSLYYSNHVFKGDPLYIQTGVTAKYFTSFTGNAYDPVISEFILQNEVEIGEYPILDFFFNMQIQRTRIFLKVENFSAAFTGRNYYAAPNYPYRDLTVRFGLVWNFFI